jgi:hypothetical protein
MLTTQTADFECGCVFFCFRHCILQSFGHHASDANLEAHVDDPQDRLWDWNNLASTGCMLFSHAVNC